MSAAAFEAGRANPLRASVMYPPDRALFAPFRMASDAEVVAGSLSRARGPLGLYAHIPFCETKCSYCDYETVPLAGHDERSIDRYVEALIAELAAISSALPSGIVVAGMDLGGGTPGSLSASQFERILAAVAGRFHLAPDFEVSTETTPTLAAADPGKWRSIAAAGVRRVSMGIQTADEGLLGRLHRAPHVPDRMRAGMDSLRAAGFPVVNVDLMFGLPGLTLSGWSRSLDLALELSPDVITIYDTVYKNRGIAIQAPRWNTVPTADDFSRQYDLAFRRLSSAGYSARYGSVNFSRVPDRLGTSRYLEARILEGCDYVGAGLYASSLIGDTWRFGRQSYRRWLECAEKGELAAEDLYRLPLSHVAAKYVLLALSYGFLDEGRYRRRFGESLASRFGSALELAESRSLLRRSPAGCLEMVAGTFGELPGLRAMFYPDDAVQYLSREVLATSTGS